MRASVGEPARCGGWVRQARRRGAGRELAGLASEGCGRRGVVGGRTVWAGAGDAADLDRQVDINIYLCASYFMFGAATLRSKENSNMKV